VHCFASEVLIYWKEFQATFSYPTKIREFFGI
jgi:hypothetical protein